MTSNALIKGALEAYATATRRADARRFSTVGASEIGQCARKIFFAKNESDPHYQIERDADHVENWGAQLRGTAFENDLWVPALRARYGDRLKFAGAEQHGLENGFISATPDGLLIDAPANILAELGVADIESTCVLLEAKTIDPRVKLDAPKPEHVYQVIVQLGIVREATDFAPQYAVISYADASFWSEISEFAVAFDSKIFATAERRATKIMTAKAAADLSPEGWIAGGRECEHCPFTRACGIERHAMPNASNARPVDSQFVAEASDLAREAKRRQADADTANARLRETQHEIRERLRAKGLRRVEGAEFSIVWSPVKGRESFDVKALKAAAAAAGVDVAKFSTVGEPTDRLDIRVRECTPQTNEVDHE